MGRNGCRRLRLQTTHCECGSQGETIILRNNSAMDNEEIPRRVFQCRMSGKREEELRMAFINPTWNDESANLFGAKRISGRQFSRHGDQCPFCWLFVIFSAIDVLRSLPLFTELIDDVHTRCNNPQDVICFRKACPVIDPVTHTQAKS